MTNTNTTRNTNTEKQEGHYNVGKANIINYLNLSTSKHCVENIGKNIAKMFGILEAEVIHCGGSELLDPLTPGWGALQPEETNGYWNCNHFRILKSTKGY